MNERQTLLDPTSEATPATRERLAPPASLSGRTVALLDIGKARGDVFIDQLGRRLYDGSKNRGMDEVLAFEEEFDQARTSRVQEFLDRVYGLDHSLIRTDAVSAEGLADFGRGERVAYADLLEEILALVAEDAAHFGCEAEVAHARTILARGTSAHLQLEAFERAREAGASEAEALRAVVDALLEATHPPVGEPGIPD